MWSVKLMCCKKTVFYHRMTGVFARPEVVIQGGDSADGPWKEYHFKYKPGKTRAISPVVGNTATWLHYVLTSLCVSVTRPRSTAPHQPRLDWQMWFAALGPYQHNPWFMNLVYRLLKNESDVLELLASNPYPDTPPEFVRAIRYNYHFTEYGTKKAEYVLQRLVFLCNSSLICCVFAGLRIGLEASTTRTSLLCLSLTKISWTT